MISISLRQPVDSANSRDFEKFLKGFALSSHSADIGAVLDLEPDVSRYYAELVPVSIKPEQFWARYFPPFILEHK